MTDRETAEHLRKWAAAPALTVWGWPTDECGYDQHIRFVQHRNRHWQGITHADFNVFVLAYADTLDPPAERSAGPGLTGTNED